MTSRQRGPSGAAKGNLSLSMILGTLLVPVSAVLAIWLSDPGQVAQAESSPASTTTSTPAATVQTATEFKSVAATESDLRAACGYVGMTLVDAERNGTISDIQQAALDSLRVICDEQGLSLPAAPTPDEQVQTVIVQDSSSDGASATAAPSVSGDDGSSHHESENEREGGEGGVDG